MGMEQTIIKPNKYQWSWTVVGCKRCENAEYPVPHFNCLYGGNAGGHSKDHCTANACW